VINREAAREKSIRHGLDAPLVVGAAAASGVPDHAASS
jgi:hypothetical protein